MGAFIRQTRAVIGITLADMVSRFWGALTTVLSIALVVATLLGFLAMSNGFARTVSATGADDIAVITTKGSGAELNSSIASSAVNLIAQAPGVTAVSPEMFVIANATKVDDGSDASLTLRGVTSAASAMRKGFAITAGRMFEPGTNEIVVGRTAARSYRDLHVGDKARFGSTVWSVVGEFSVPGTAFESEIWTDLPVGQSMFNRAGGVQTVRARVASPGAVGKLQAYLDADPRLHVDVVSERQFYAREAGGLSMLVVFGWALAITMSLGAIAGAINMMQAAVDARTKSLATLRAIGFRGAPAFIGAMTEALLLAGLGGAMGAGLSVAAFNGLSLSTTGSSYSQIAFTASLGPEHIATGVTLALVLGLLGGLAPAIRAACTPILRLSA